MLDLDEHSATDLISGILAGDARRHGGRATHSGTRRGSCDGNARSIAPADGGSRAAVAEWIAADTVFHATIVRAAGNPYLGAVYESVHTTILSYEYKQWVQSDKV